MLEEFNSGSNKDGAGAVSGVESFNQSLSLSSAFKINKMHITVKISENK
jgi:hypothetical protein